MRVLAAAAVAALALTASPAAAQSGGTVFVDLGRWTIYEMTSAGYCEMRLNAGATGNLVMTKRAGSPASLRLTLNNAPRGFGNEVVWAFDEEQYGGSVVGRGIFAPSSDSSAIEAAFRRARTLSLLQDGSPIATVSLQSSSAGYRLLDQCADQWRRGFFPPRDLRTAAAPMPAREEPRTLLSAETRAEVTPTRPQLEARRGPYPPNRAVTPLDAASWVQREDFGNLPALRGDGVLRFSLAVNREGRVEECTVLVSSGSRQLDGQTCRTLQRRARFAPATDASGNAVEATYTSEVKFAVPE
jgi:TonB family protein